MTATLTNMAEYKAHKQCLDNYRRALAEAAPTLRKLQQAYTEAIPRADHFGLVLAMLANAAEKAQGEGGGAA